MKHLRPGWGFIATNVLVWCAMTAILVVVPDWLDRWLPLEVSRVLGWALACGVWVVAVEQQWKVRYGPFTRFAAQLVLWVSAALFALWVSDELRIQW